MTLRASDIIPSARLEHASPNWPKTWWVAVPKVLTKNGSSYVALVDAKSSTYHALELEHAGLVLLTEAETALGQVIAGKRMSPAELDKLLAD